VQRSACANLDLLRAMAVLLVLAQHLCRRFNVDQVGWVPISSLGYFGVLLFFVHTSLVLMYSMERSHLTGWLLLKNFHIRRIFRIYPLSVIAVLAALTLHLDSDINGVRGLSHGALPGKLTILSNLLLIQNLTYAKSIVNVLWSLPFELQMYVLLPFLFIWIHRKPMFKSLIGLWMVCAVAGTLQPHIPGLGRLSILRYIPNFLPGVIAFAFPRIPRIRAFLWPVFILTLIGAFTFFPTLAMGWTLCLILGLMIPSFEEIISPWLRVIANRIATYSYGIYVSHQFCIWFAFGALGAQPLWLQVPVLIGSLTLLPILFYYGIEKPMIAVGMQIARRESKQQARVATAAAS
jgi:peptidoglycan/LPS O-acetylase OafA/YrhL